MEQHLIIAALTSKILMAIIFLFQMLLYILQGIFIALIILFVPLMFFSGNSELGEAVTFAFNWSITVALVISIIPAIYNTLKNLMNKEKLFSNKFI